MKQINQFICPDKPNYRELALIKEAEKRLIANRGKYRQQKSHLFESDYAVIRPEKFRRALRGIEK